MYRKAHPLFLICETPLHAGSGSDLGIIDLPIQRERHTGFPKIEGSSLKGSIREAIERKVKPNPSESWDFYNRNTDAVKIHRVFGYDDGSLKSQQKEALKKLFAKNEKQEEFETSFAGCVSFSDARLLLFPVKSMKGVFAWITCPKVLQLFTKEMEMAGQEILALPKEGTTASKNKITINVAGNAKALLEEYAFDVKVDEQVNNLGNWLSDHLFQESDAYWKEKVKTDIIVLSDDEFRDFVQLSTEVITRIKIDNEIGTVANGNLFTEEYLPAESILYTLVLTAPEFTSLDGRMSEAHVGSFLESNIPEIIQAGANATIGKGMLKTKFIKNTTV